MKILVCISHVPDTTSKINFTENETKFDSNGVQFVINPYDEFALTKAMFLKEKQGASITVVNVGNASTEPTLRKALAIGADNAIRVNTEATDGFAVAKELAEVVKNGEYNLVLAGKESIDYNGGMVPGMLAAMLNYNFVNACIGLEIEGETATIHREIDGGKEVLSSNLPLIIAGQKGLVEEKDPTALELLKEFNMPMVALGLSDDEIKEIILYLKNLDKNINQEPTSTADLPSRYIFTLIISILLIIFITLLALKVGKKNVDIK